MRKLRIIIVEDEAISALCLKKSLEEMGHIVLKVFASGESLLKEYNSFKPDVILMDIFLNGHINGIDAVKRIHDDMYIPVIYLTASTDEKTYVHAKETNMLGYINKPINELVVKEYLEKV